MATCPSGHDSASVDFCDVCGIRMGPAAGVTATVPAPAPPAAPAAAEACPQCGAARTGQFCESCGHDFTKATPASPVSPTGFASVVPPPPATPPTAATWSAVVTADRAYFDRVVAAIGPDATELSFPAYCPERRFPLSGAEVRVGRRSVSRGIHPEIDLTGPPADPGVSRLHALLIAGPDGTWSVVDPGSENGTLLNGNEIPVNQAMPLHDGDRVHLGAWTAVTITRDLPAA